MLELKSKLLELLNEYPEKTCLVLSKGKVIYSSEAKGVKPLKDYYEKWGVSKDELIVVDRIMGKGAVMLAALIGAKRLVTPVISETALAFAETNGIKAEYLKVVPFIINRTGDGKCPIETAVTAVDDVKHGYEVICTTINNLTRLRRKSDAV